MYYSYIYQILYLIQFILNQILFRADGIRYKNILRINRKWDAYGIRMDLDFYRDIFSLK